MGKKTIEFNTVEPRSNGFQGTKIVFCYRRTFVITNKGSKRNQLEGTINLVTSVIDKILLVAGPLRWGSTVRKIRKVFFASFLSLQTADAAAADTPVAAECGERRADAAETSRRRRR